MARPSTGVSERYLGVRVPKEYYRALKQKAEEEDKPIAVIVRDILGAFIYPELVNKHTLRDIGGVNALDELYRYEQLLVDMANANKQTLDILNDRIEAVRRCVSTAEEFIRQEEVKLW